MCVGEKQGGSKIRRGMVFWYDPQKNPEYIHYGTQTIKHSHVQAGIRPHLVVSADESNNGVLTCNVIPLTTAENKGFIDTNVTFMYGSKCTTVLVSQITTVDQGALGEYYFSVDEEVMIRVEEALMAQFGIKPFCLDNIDIDTAYEYFSKIVDKINKFKDKFNGVEKVGVSEVTTTKVTQAHDEPKSKNKKPHRNYTRWDEDSMLEFLVDCESMSRDKVGEKWKITSDQVSKRRYQFKKKLEENTGSDHI